VSRRRHRGAPDATAAQVGRAGQGVLDLADAPQAPLPRNIRPMLATPVESSFDRPGWVFEVKWDGYRAIAEVSVKQVRLYSRKHLSFERTYAPIVESLKQLGHEAVLDGEIVVLDDSGKPQFQLLQNYQSTKKGPLVYFVFDLLYLDGHDLRGLPLLRRKELLARIVPDLPGIQLSEHVEERGIAFFEAVAEQGLEGIVAKDGRSRYHEGLRSPSWLKIKTHLRQDAIICGYTGPRGTRQHFGALILGLYDGDKLVPIGNVGTGFSTRSLAAIHTRLEPLRQAKAAFPEPPRTDTPARWVRPELVCEVSFAGWSADGHMRHPVFQGLREDVPARGVQRERAQAVDSLVEATPLLRPGLGTIREKNVRLQVGDHVLQLTNLDKTYWPEDGYAKGDLLDYYRQVSAFILPYLKDRPQSLHRHPNGIHGKSFFQKDVSKQPPPAWVQTVELSGEQGSETIRSVLCQDEATLLYLANLGCIELNPWNSRIARLDSPDYLLIDLDPEDISFERVIETAQSVRRTLEKIGAASLCKTSGKRGLHIYVPLGSQYTHAHAKQFAELIANVVHRQLPGTTSLLRLPQQRQQRVYLDWLQNGEGKTLAAPYCVRPVPGATVSTPLKWAEVRRGLDPGKFTIRTMPKRLSMVGDLWRPVLGTGIDLYACLERLTTLLQRDRRSGL
jgi:bifunctional non-homologous end joining protein LigD